MSVNILEPSFDCPKCEYSTGVSRELETHMSEEHDAPREEWAESVFGLSQKQIDVARENEGIRVKQCGICDKMFELYEFAGERAWGIALPPNDPRGDYCCADCYPPIFE